MEPESLRHQLDARGLVVLAVTRHRSDPDVLVVYLHGPAGQWVGGAARATIEAVPGVALVVESVGTPTILLVRVAPMAT